MDKEKLLQFWQNLSLIQKIGIISVILIVLLWIFLLSPKLEKFKNLKLKTTKINGELQQERLRLINANKEIKKLSGYKEEVQRLETKLEYFKNQLISEDKILNLADILTFKENSIEYLLFTAKPTTKNGKVTEEGGQSKEEDRLYKKLPIEVKIESTYFLLSQYLNYIEKSDFPISVDKVVVKKIEDSYNKINTNLKLTVYVAK